MSDNVETMADLIGRHCPVDDGWESDADRDDLPELASALERTGRIWLRDKTGNPVVYEAIPGPEGFALRVRRQAFLSKMVRSEAGESVSADDASEAKSHGSLAFEVPVPKV
jgi:hypothetical protein